MLLKKNHISLIRTFMLKKPKTDIKLIIKKSV